jgi:hypothetical protein
MLALYWPILISQSMLSMWETSLTACELMIPRRKQGAPTIILME